jgi:hypothetical protein
LGEIIFALGRTFMLDIPFGKKHAPCIIFGYAKIQGVITSWMGGQGNYFSAGIFNQ